MTLTEMMVGVGIGSIVFLAVGSVTLYAARSFSSMANYSDLNQTSRKALDLMTREIRESPGLVSYSATNLIFKADTNGSVLSIAWNKQAKTVTQIKTGPAGSTNILKNCTFWTNEVFQQTPKSNNFSLTPSTTVSQTRVIDLKWVCAQARVNTTNSETVQSMKVVLRNK